MFAVESRHSNIFISRNNNAVSLRDFVGSQNIFRPARAVSFYLDRNSALFGVLFETFRRHERVSDTRRASRDGENLNVIGSRDRRGVCRICGSLKFAVLFVVNEL